MSFLSKKDALASIKKRVQVFHGANYTIYEAYLGTNPFTRKVVWKYARSEIKLKKKLRTSIPPRGVSKFTPLLPSAGCGIIVRVKGPLSIRGLNCEYVASSNPMSAALFLSAVLRPARKVFLSGVGLICCTSPSAVLHHKRILQAKIYSHCSRIAVGPKVFGIVLRGASVVGEVEAKFADFHILAVCRASDSGFFKHREIAVRRPVPHDQRLAVLVHYATPLSRIFARGGMAALLKVAWRS